MDETVGVGVGPAERAHHAGGDGPTPEPRRRMSARRKQETVLRLLRGEDLELLSRQLGMSGADLSGWRGAFLAADEALLTIRPADARDAGPSKHGHAAMNHFGCPMRMALNREVVVGPWDSHIWSARRCAAGGGA